MYHVLYVDDEPALLEIAKVFLEESGEFTILTTTSATGVLANGDLPSYDAIISDYQMPEMDGITFLKEVRTRFAEIPFILFTGKGREEVVIEAINNGVDFYIQKGGDPTAQFAELVHKIRMAIERRRSKRALIGSEQRYRNVVEDQTEFISRFRPDGTHVFVNDAYCRYFGISCKEILETRFRPAIHPEDKKRVDEFFSSLTTDHPSGTIEHRIIMPDGSVRWHRWNNRAIFDQPGCIIEYQSVGQDITEQKEAEREIQESEKKFRDIFNNVNDAIQIYEIDAQGRPGKFIEVNDVACRKLQYSRSELLEKTPREIAVANYRRPHEELWEEMKTVGNVVFEMAHIRKDGTLLPVEVNAHSTTLKGKPVVVSAIRDISERKKVEGQLVASEKFNRDVISYAMEGIIVYDKELCIVRWNKFMEDLTGIPAEEILGKNAIEQFPFHKETGVADLLAQALSGTPGESSDFEFTIPSTGRKGWVRGSYSPHYDANGDIVGVIGIVRDIARRKKYEDQIINERENFHKILSTAPVGLLLINRDTVITQANQYVSSIVFREPAQIIGNRAGGGIGCIHSTGDPRGCGYSTSCPGCPLRKGIEQVLEKGTLLAGEIIECTLLIQGRPQHRWLSIHAAPVELDEERYSIVSVDDITSHMEYEEERIRRSDELHAAYEQIAATEEELRQNYDELKAVEESLRTSEHQFRSLFDHLINGLALHELVPDSKGKPIEYRIIQVNPAFETLLGMKREDVVGKLSCSAYGTLEPPYLDMYARVALGGAPHSFETYYPPMKKYFSISVYSPGDGLFATVFEDVTRRKEAEQELIGKNKELAASFEEITATEEELRQGYQELAAIQQLLQESRQYLHSIVDGSPIPTFVIDREHRVTSWNQALEDYLEVPAAWIIGQPLAGQAFYKTDRPSLADLIADQAFDELQKWYNGIYSPSALIEGAYEVTDFFPEMKGGTWLFFTASPIYNDSGELIGAIETLQDITGRKEAEQKLALANEELNAAFEELAATEEELRQNLDEISSSHSALAESEGKFRSLAECSQDYIMRYDRDCRHLYMNPAALRISGLTEDQVIGKTHKEAGFDEDLSRVWEKNILQVFKTGEPVQLQFEWGSVQGPVVLDYRLTPEFEEHGNVQSVLGVSRDITELKRVEHAFRQANQQLRLLSGIARHDILNKVTVLLGYAAIARQSASDPSMVAFIDKVESVTKKIQEQIEFTRVYQDLGSHVPQWQEIDKVLPRSHIPATITLNTELKGVELFADPVLPSVFWNLLDNSVRHGKNVTDIRVSTTQSGEVLTVVWEDNGIGVPAGEKEKIFLQGYGKNTGLGMFFVREILSLTDISIRETGVPGKGARFEITVPKGAWRVIKPQ